MSSMQKARAIRSEFVDRDLREIVGRFEADERTTLQLNVDRLLTDVRQVTPLLLPRQYYVALPPPSIRSTPRQPPRNCFVSLVPVVDTVDISKSSPVKVCPYFAESKILGKYLFFSASLNDDSIVPLKPGDTSVNADALKVTVVKGDKVVSWWLTFQPTLTGNRNRYEVTAVRESVKGLRERDKRIEGWAYVQRQVDGTQVVQIITRIDFKEFLTEEELTDQDAGWPPKGWQDVSLSFSRKDVTENLPGSITTIFKKAGISQLSVVGLSEPLYNSHANLYIQSPSFSGSNKTRAIKPSNEDSEKNFRIGRVSFIDGDVLVASDELVRSRILTDTNLTFVATHPGNVIEKGIWQAILYSALLFLTGVFCLAYLFRHLLIPIFTLTRQSRRLVALSGNGDAKLPYANQVNEIGTLARGINELLDETRLSATREVAERNARQEADA